jgi:mono/diheme cytochrome c family protein
VIHSWWVPALGGKTDAIPGNPNHSWFKAERTGIFRGQCAEFCGIQHAVMRATVEVMPRAEFDAWLADEARKQQAGTSELGSETWAASCAKCHGMQAEGLVGPNIAGNSLLQDRKGLETLVREGGVQMPPVGQTWGDRQMDALFKYVSTEFKQGGGS